MVEANVKSVGVTLSKALLVAIGVPYGIAIIAHTATGWQHSDPKKSRFISKLHPDRVLRMNYAIGHQFSAARWLPVVSRSKTFHKNSDQSLKNIPFGHNGMKMDVWMPLANFRKDNMTSAAMFVYGGAWATGHKEMYAKFGQEVANALGIPVVIPDYRLYPMGTMQDMVQDVIDSILETRRRSSDLSISGSNIILMGHSAGAHLVTLAAVQLASKDLYTKNLVPKPNIPDDKLPNNLGKDSGLRQHEDSENRALDEDSDEKISEISRNMEQNLTGSSIQSSSFSEINESQVENADKDSSEVKSCYSDLLESVKGVIGIGGVYHIMGHYQHETKRGLEDLSPMWRAAEGLHNFERYSPAVLVSQLSEREKERLPPHIFIHGEKDIVVPSSSASLYSSILSEAGVPTKLKVVTNGAHGELIMDIMEADRKWYSVMLGLVMESVGSFLKGSSN